MTMETIEYRTIDKSEWGPGEWQDEPDKKQWRDEATGLPCLIVRNGSGALCGYVGVPRNHVYYGSDYDKVDVEVHGGLTFAGKCSPSPTRERWEKWRQSIYAGREEAKRYPLGDAAQRLKDRAVELEDFDAYCRWCEAATICHVAPEGEDDVWWFGFDCAHAWDLSPGSRSVLRSIGHERDSDDVYRDLRYVEAEVARLASQMLAFPSTVAQHDD